VSPRRWRLGASIHEDLAHALRMAPCIVCMMTGTSTHAPSSPSSRSSGSAAAGALPGSHDRGIQVPLQHSFPFKAPINCCAHAGRTPRMCAVCVCASSTAQHVTAQSA
jgi:hypothetical protein